jgi:predicted membrane protein
VSNSLLTPVHLCFLIPVHLSPHFFLPVSSLLIHTTCLLALIHTFSRSCLLVLSTFLLTFVYLSHHSCQHVSSILSTYLLTLVHVSPHSCPSVSSF